MVATWDVWDVKMRGGLIGHEWDPQGVDNTVHTVPSLASNKHITLPKLGEIQCPICVLYVSFHEYDTHGVS